MTDLDNFIERFNLHVEEILIYENRHESKLKEPLILGEISNLPPPQYFTDEKEQMGHGGFHRNGTEQVIKELAKIGFIDFHEDPSLIFHMKRTIDELFVGITCYYSYQSDYKQMSRIETYNYVHAASVYECMKRRVKQLTQDWKVEYSKYGKHKILVLINAMECFDEWAKDKCIAIKNKFIDYKELNGITVSPVPDIDDGIYFDTKGKYLIIVIKKQPITIKNPLCQFIKYLIESYSDQEEFRGSEQIHYYNYKVEKGDYPKGKLKETNLPRLFRSAKNEGYKEILDYLFYWSENSKMGKDKFQLKLVQN